MFGPARETAANRSLFPKEVAVLNLHRLLLLSELHHRGTLSEVARALNYSPSSISQQLAALEAEVGVKLLTPVGRRVCLTRQGELLVRHADAMLSSAEQAEAELRASLNEPRGVVSVACFQTAALALVPDLLSDVRGHWPHLELLVAEIPPDGAIQALLDHDFDMVLGEEYPGRAVERDAGIRLTELARDELRMVCPPALPRPHRLEDLANADWVMEPAGNAAREWALATCREAGFEPRVRFESGDLLVQVRLVETGHAVGLLPDMLWATRESDLTRLSLDPPQSRRIFTAVRSGVSEDPGLVAVRRSLEATVGRRPLRQ
jgi:DNA-binding transcriptional LysR family regulator